MAKIVTASEIDIQIKGGESLKGLTSQITDAKNEAAKLINEFGEFSPQAKDAVQNLAGLKKEMSDINKRSNSINTSGFESLSKAASGIASGIAAAQGAMNLFGESSEGTEKALLKVQSAMALSEGLKGLGKGVGEVQELGKSIGGTLVNSFKSAAGAARAFGAALGIGLILIAVAAVVAYWDELKEFIGLGASEQKKQADAAKESVSAAESALEALEGSTNQLKLQGLSEKEILQLKIKQTDEVIAANITAMAAQIALNKEEVASTERKKNGLKSLIRFTIELATLALRALAAPIDAVIFLINKTSEQLGFGKAIDFSINEKISELNDSLSETAAKMMFDPEETKLAGDNTIKEAQKTLDKLVEKRAGNVLAIQAIDQAAADKSKEGRAKAKAESDREAQKQKEADAKLAEEKAKELKELIEATEREAKVLSTEKFALKLLDLTEKFEEEKLLLEGQYLALETLEKNFQANKKIITDEAEAAALAAQKSAAEKAAAIAKKTKDDAEERFKKRWDAIEAIQNQAFSVASEFSNLMGELGGKNLKVQKAQALIQIGIDTASAISSLVKMSQANIRNVGTGGVAGALQFAAGIIQITANMAKAANILGKSNVNIPTDSGGDQLGQLQKDAAVPPPLPIDNRVYVVETDITTTQARISALNKVGVVI
jgi:hypothetical protein